MVVLVCEDAGWGVWEGGVWEGGRRREGEAEGEVTPTTMCLSISLQACI